MDRERNETTTLVSIKHGITSSYCHAEDQRHKATNDDDDMDRGGCRGPVYGLMINKQASRDAVPR